MGEEYLTTGAEIQRRGTAPTTSMAYMGGRKGAGVGCNVGGRGVRAQAKGGGGGRCVCGGGGVARCVGNESVRVRSGVQPERRGGLSSTRLKGRWEATKGTPNVRRAVWARRYVRGRQQRWRGVACVAHCSWWGGACGAWGGGGGVAGGVRQCKGSGHKQTGMVMGKAN